MARARNIKPGFCRNEELAECSVWARLCFALLPMLADREGRLEDRPKRIKGELFPFDTVDVEPLLAELNGRGLIARYTVHGIALIQILAFEKHQNPHHREPPSTLPTHPSLRLDADGKWVKPEASAPSQPQPAQGEPEADPGLEKGVSLGKAWPSRADSGFLIPDSPPTPQGSPGQDLAGSVPSERMPACPSDAILEAYHRRLPMLPRVRVLTAAHRKSLVTRWSEVCSDDDIRRAEDVRSAALDWWGWYFGHVATAPHLIGRNGSDWRASFDWLIKAENFAKVVNGNYHPQGATA